MTSRMINGAKFAVSSALGAAAAITAVNNANPGVASSLTPPTEGDVVVLTFPGLPELDDSVVRAGTVVAGTSFELEGVDTTDAVRFPTEDSAGAYRAVSGFVPLSQVRDLDMSGGDQQFHQFQNVEDPTSRQRQDPTFKNPMVLRIDLAYDPALPWFAALKEADRRKEPVVVREVLPNGDTTYYYGMMSFNGVATKSLNEHMLVSATLSLYADPIRYDAA